MTPSNPLSVHISDIAALRRSRILSACFAWSNFPTASSSTEGSIQVQANSQECRITESRGFQPVICPACALSCLASDAVATTAPGKRATANSLAETGFGLVVRLRVSPGVDEVPYSQLVCVRQALKQPDKISERPLVVIRPRENEVERLPCELVGWFVRCTAAGARRVVTPAGPVVGKKRTEDPCSTARCTPATRHLEIASSTSPATAFVQRAKRPSAATTNGRAIGGCRSAC